MNFRETIAAIPFTGSQQWATGLLAPIMRACGHILYTVGALAEEGYNLDDEEAHRELDHAAQHLARTVAVAEQAPISTAAKDRIRHFVSAVQLANEEWGQWDIEDRGPNLKDLADRAASLGAFFDAELAGVAGSDPGRSL